jgi:hypothetical protein
MRYPSDDVEGVSRRRARRLSVKIRHLDASSAFEVIVERRRSSSARGPHLGHTLRDIDQARPRDQCFVIVTTLDILVVLRVVGVDEERHGEHPAKAECYHHNEHDSTNQCRVKQKSNGQHDVLLRDGFAMPHEGIVPHML